MVDSVAPVIGRAGLLVLFVLLLVTPAQATTTTHTWRVGPVDMRGYATEQALQDTRAPRMFGYLTAMHARIVDAAGNPVPQERVMLHHVFFVNHGRFRGDRRAGDCRARNGETFYGTGLSPAHRQGNPAMSNIGAARGAAVPVSSARAAASRTNGARSRGPQTALKHGLRAQMHVVLAEEDDREFPGPRGHADREAFARGRAPGRGAGRRKRRGRSSAGARSAAAAERTRAPRRGRCAP